MMSDGVCLSQPSWRGRLAAIAQREARFVPLAVLLLCTLMALPLAGMRRHRLASDQKLIINMVQKDMDPSLFAGDTAFWSDGYQAYPAVFRRLIQLTYTLTGSPFGAYVAWVWPLTALFCVGAYAMFRFLSLNPVWAALMAGICALPRLTLGSELFGYVVTESVELRNLLCLFVPWAVALIWLGRTGDWRLAAGFVVLAVGSIFHPLLGGFLAIILGLGLLVHARRGVVKRLLWLTASAVLFMGVLWPSLQTHYRQMYGAKGAGLPVLSGVLPDSFEIREAQASPHTALLGEFPKKAAIFLLCLAPMYAAAVFAQRSAGREALARSDRRLLWAWAILPMGLALCMGGIRSYYDVMGLRDNVISIQNWMRATRYVPFLALLPFGIMACHGWRSSNLRQRRWILLGFAAAFGPVIVSVAAMEYVHSHTPPVRELAGWFLDQPGDARILCPPKAGLDLRLYSRRSVILSSKDRNVLGRKFKVNRDEYIRLDKILCSTDMEAIRKVMRRYPADYAVLPEASARAMAMPICHTRDGWSIVDLRPQ